MDFSSILLYGALGVFAVLVLVIIIPLMYSLMNKSEKANTAVRPKRHTQTAARTTRSMHDQNRSMSGQFVIPDKAEHHARRKTAVHDVPRHTREQYIESTQPKPRNHRKNWQNQWR